MILQRGFESYLMIRVVFVYIICICAATCIYHIVTWQFHFRCIYYEII